MSNKRIVYLDNACTGLYSQKVLSCAEIFVALLNEIQTGLVPQSVVLQGLLDEARNKVAELVNCDVSEVALVESTSHGLGIVSEVVDIKPEENVLVCDLEYQASYFCLTRKQRKIGFEIRHVKSKENEITAEIFKKYIDRNTRLIILSSVQEINGYRADLKAISDLAHQYGCYVAIDGVQEVGAMHVDVKKMGIDFYCTGAKKWIGSPFGMGFMYIKKQLIDILEPAYDTYFNALLPKHYPDYDTYLENPDRSPFDEMEMINTAQKFEINGYRNYLGAMGLTKAIEVLQKYGLKEIEEKIISLNLKFTEGLRQLGIDTVSSKDRPHMSSTVSFNLGFKGGGSSEEKKLMDYLLEKNIIVSLRCASWTGGIRVSMHYYTTEEDIDSILFAIGNFLSLQQC